MTVRRCLLIALIATPLLHRAAAAQSAADSSYGDRFWLSAGVGPGEAKGESRLGGAVSLWFTRGTQVFALRRAGASRFLETGDTYDTALMYGVRHIERHVTAVVGAGLGVAQSTTHGGDHEPNAAALALGAEGAFSLRAVGLGVAAFASLGRHSFVGAALVFELGYID